MATPARQMARRRSIAKADLEGPPRARPMFGTARGLVRGLTGVTVRARREVFWGLTASGVWLPA